MKYEKTIVNCGSSSAEHINVCRLLVHFSCKYRCAALDFCKLIYLPNISLNKKFITTAYPEKCRCNLGLFRPKIVPKYNFLIFSCWHHKVFEQQSRFVMSPSHFIVSDSVKNMEKAVLKKIFYYLRIFTSGCLTKNNIISIDTLVRHQKVMKHRLLV